MTCRMQGKQLDCKHILSVTLFDCVVPKVVI